MSSPRESKSDSSVSSASKSNSTSSNARKVSSTFSPSSPSESSHTPVTANTISSGSTAREFTRCSTANPFSSASTASPFSSSFFEKVDDVTTPSKKQEVSLDALKKSSAVTESPSPSDPRSPRSTSTQEVPKMHKSDSDDVPVDEDENVFEEATAMVLALEGESGEEKMEDISSLKLDSTISSLKLESDVSSLIMEDLVSGRGNSDEKEDDISSLMLDESQGPEPIPSSATGTPSHSSTHIVNKTFNEHSSSNSGVDKCVDNNLKEPDNTGDVQKSDHTASTATAVPPTAPLSTTTTSPAATETPSKTVGEGEVASAESGNIIDMTVAPPMDTDLPKEGFELVTVNLHATKNQQNSKYGLMIWSTHSKVLITLAAEGTPCHGLVKELDQILRVNGEPVNEEKVAKNLMVTSLEQQGVVQLLVLRPISPEAIEMVKLLMDADTEAPSDFDAVSQSAVIEGAEEPADKKNELAKASAERQETVQNEAGESSPRLPASSPVVTPGSRTSGVHPVGQDSEEQKKAQELPSESLLSPRNVNSSPAAIVTTSDSADAAQMNEAEEPAFVNPTQDSNSSVILNGTQSGDDDQEIFSDDNNEDSEDQPENNDDTSGSNSFSWIHKKKKRVTCKEDTSSPSAGRHSPATAPESFFLRSPPMIQSPFANMIHSFGDSFRSEPSTTDEPQRKQRRDHGKDESSSSSVGPHPFGSDADEGDVVIANDDVESLLEKTTRDSRIENEQLKTVTSAEGETPKKKSRAAPKKKKERFLPGLFGSEESVVDGQKKTSSDTPLQPASSAAPHPELTRRRKRKAISRTTGGKNSQNSGGNTRTRGKKGAKKAIGEEFVEMLEEVKSRLTNEVKCYKLSHLLQCETHGELLRPATSKRIENISKIMDNRKMKTRKLRILTSRWHFCLSRETADHAEPARVLIIDGCARILSFKQNGLTSKQENTLVQAMVTVVEAKEFQLLWEASTPLVAEEEEEDEEERRNKAGCGLLNVFLHYFSSLSGDDGEQYTAIEKFILVKGAADELIPAAERDQVPDDRIEGITTAMVKQGLIEKSLTWALQLSFCHPLSLAVAKDILQTKGKFYVRGHFPVLVGKASRKDDKETAGLLQLLHDGEADAETVAEELHYLLGDVANRRIKNGGLSRTLPSSSIIIKDFPSLEDIPAQSVVILFEEQIKKADLVDWIEAVDHCDALAVFVVCQGSSAVLQTEFIDWVNEATGSTRRWFQTLRVRERITLVACVSGDGLLFADGKKETRLEKLLEEHVESGLLILRPTGDPPRKEKTPAKSDINATSPH